MGHQFTAGWSEVQVTTSHTTCDCRLKWEHGTRDPTHFHVDGVRTGRLTRAAGACYSTACSCPGPPHLVSAAPCGAARESSE